MTVYFSKNIKDTDLKFSHNLYSSLQFVLSNVGLISLIVWKLCAFRQRRNFGNFQQFFRYKFRLQWKFKLLMVQSKRTSTDLVLVVIISFENIPYFKVKQLLSSFFRNTSKVQRFCKFHRLHRMNHIKIYQTSISFY